MDDFKNFIIDSASILTFIHYAVSFVKWFLKWIQPKMKKSSKKKRKRRKK